MSITWSKFRVERDKFKVQSLNLKEDSIFFKLLTLSLKFLAFFILSSNYSYSQDSLYFFQAKSDIEITKSGAKESFTAHIRYNLRDTLWISFTGSFGIEGARMLVTEDSTYIINKLDGTGYVMKTGEENELIPFGFTLDDWKLILVQIPYAIEPSAVNKESNFIENSYIQNNISKKVKILKNRIESCTFNQFHTAIICEVDLSEYEKTKHRFEIARARKIKISGPNSDNVQILINYVDYKFNQRQPFVFNFAKYRNGSQ